MIHRQKSTKIVLIFKFSSLFSIPGTYYFILASSAFFMAQTLTYKTFCAKIKNNISSFIYNQHTFTMNKIKYDIQLTRNFKLSEFIRSDVAVANKIILQYAINMDVVNNVFVLCTKILQPLRGQIGAIHISSGYRCQQLNQYIGGVSNSQHLYGEAADIVPKCIDTAVSAIIKMDFDQLIVYKSFIHVSYSLTNNRRILIYNR